MGEEKKHPPGLYILFFTEMWERFGFYLMLGIFSLYLKAPTDLADPAKRGLGWSKEYASDVSGTYLGLVYLTPFVGGLLADRHLGYRLSIFVGGALMALGYFGLALPGEQTLWPALLLIILGNGLFKPNISTLLGNLYSEERYKPYKDTGYNIFYMGINIGAFTCNFVAAYLRNQYGWGYAFAAGGVGMLIGLVIFAFGQGRVRSADVRKPPQPEDMPLWHIVGLVFAPAALFGLAGWYLPTLLIGHPIFGEEKNSVDAFLFACVPILVFYLSLWWRAGAEDRRGIAALLIIFTVSIVFWAVYNQNATALNFWADEYTDRSMPAALVPAARSVGMTQDVGRTQDNGKEEPYLKNLPKEQWPKEGEKLHLVSPEIFESVNPLWIVLLTPVVVGAFSFLKRRGAEPSTPGKIDWGLAISALSPLILAVAVYACHNGADKASAGWLVGAYLAITVGELCLSPMGLSLVSKVSPPRLTALMMGGWFLSTSIGGKLSGVLAGMLEKYENKAHFFFMNMALFVVAALVLLPMVPWLRGVVRERTGSD